MSDWSSDVCSSDLPLGEVERAVPQALGDGRARRDDQPCTDHHQGEESGQGPAIHRPPPAPDDARIRAGDEGHAAASAPSLTTAARRSEEHTSELQSLMRISYAAFRLKQKNSQRSIT